MARRLQTRLRDRPYAFTLALAVLLLAANVVAQPSFGASGNWPEEVATLAPFALVTMASTPSILSGGGGLDLSIGPLMIVTNVVLVTWLIPHHGLDSAWVDIPILLTIGAAIGAVNGFLVGVLRYQPVIATLCSFFVLGGLATTISGSQAVAAHNWTSGLDGSIGPIPIALLFIAVPGSLWFALSRTSFHRNLYAVGADDATAYSAGVNVALVRITAYALGGMIAAIGGIALTALVESGEADQVTAYTVIALAAVALGGTPIGGGRGGMVGSVLGALSIYLIQSVLGAAHVSSSWLELVYGVMLIVGVVLGAWVRMTGTARAAVSA